jgi:hypothetical protein
VTVDLVSNPDATAADSAGYLVAGMPNYERTPTAVQGHQFPRPAARRSRLPPGLYVSSNHRRIGKGFPS